MYKTERINFRATEQEARALRRLQAAYGLESLSEAARKAIMATAGARGLTTDNQQFEMLERQSMEAI